MTHTSLSLDKRRKSSSDSNLDFWSVTTLGILKMNLGNCSNIVGVSKGNISVDLVSLRESIESLLVLSYSHNCLKPKDLLFTQILNWHHFECKDFWCLLLWQKRRSVCQRKIYQFVAVRVGHKKLPLLPKCKLLVWLPIGPPVHQQLPLRGTALPQTNDNPYIGCADWTSGANGADCTALHSKW